MSVIDSPDMTAEQAALDVLKGTFGYDAFRPGQDAAIHALLAGQNVLAVMPTGAGKSLCYQVPALVRGGLTVVISPLVALMQDQVAALKLAGVNAASLNSSIPPAEAAGIWDGLRAGRISLLYLSPERLMMPDMIESLKDLRPVMFAVDEAHCISQWGPAFRPEYDMLQDLRGLFPGVPVVALTATADPLTRDVIADKLFANDVEIITTGFDRPNLQLHVQPKKSWKQQLLAFIGEHENENGIVYCLSRKKVDETAAMLRDAGVDALAYHAGMDKRDREANQQRFMRDPGVVMVATIAFGMGIDKPDIRFVFHTDLPGSPEAYYQEIGRAGRDGEPAVVHMLYGLDDMRMRRVFIENEDSDPDRKRREHKRLDALLGYCETPSCRRQTLLSYFGEDTAACGNCDICLNPVETKDGTIEAQKILSAVYRTGQVFGQSHIIDVLRGNETEKVRDRNHQSLPTFGVGTDKSVNEWKSIIRQLAATGVLDIDIHNYGSLKITPKGRELLRGNETFHYRPDTVQGRARPKRKAAPAVMADLTDEQAVLFSHLKKLRLKLAKAQGVAAYMVFSDKTLRDMAVRRPASRDEFSAVHGVGQAKLEKFADVFLEEIAGHSAATATG